MDEAAAAAAEDEVEVVVEAAAVVTDGTARADEEAAVKETGGKAAKARAKGVSIAVVIIREPIALSSSRPSPRRSC